MPQSAISKTKYTVILTASVPVISKTKYTVVFHQRLLRKLQYYGAGNKIYVTKANERTENSFELPRVRHFDLSVDLFASALIGPQSAPRAFHSRFSRRNRTCSKILWRAFGPMDEKSEDMSHAAISIARQNRIMESSVRLPTMWCSSSVLLYVHRDPHGLLGPGSPGRPPRLSHSSWAL